MGRTGGSAAGGEGGKCPVLHLPSISAKKGHGGGDHDDRDNDDAVVVVGQEERTIERPWE